MKAFVGVKVGKHGLLVLFVHSSDPLENLAQLVHVNLLM